MPTPPETDVAKIRKYCRARVPARLLHQVRVEAAVRGNSDVVGKWDLGAYRHAEARLRILSQEPDVKTALETLHEAGANLGDTWRTESGDKATIDSALTAHRDAIEQLLAPGGVGPASEVPWPTTAEKREDER